MASYGRSHRKRQEDTRCEEGRRRRIILILLGALTTQMASYGRSHIEAILRREPKPPAQDVHHAPQTPYPAHRR